MRAVSHAPATGARPYARCLRRVRATAGLPLEQPDPLAAGAVSSASAAPARADAPSTASSGGSRRTRPAGGISTAGAPDYGSSSSRMSGGMRIRRRQSSSNGRSHSRAEASRHPRCDGCAAARVPPRAPAQRAAAPAGARRRRAGSARTRRRSRRRCAAGSAGAPGCGGARDSPARRIRRVRVRPWSQHVGNSRHVNLE
jgi:hypothetical protein